MKGFLPPINHKQPISNDSFMEKSELSFNKKLHSSSIYEGVNQIIGWDSGDANIVYIPAYLRIQVNRVNRMDYIGCVAEVDTYLTLWLKMKQLPIQVQNQIIQNGELRINGNKGIKLHEIVTHKNNSQSSTNLSKTTTTFHLKQSLTMQIQTNTFLSPFEVVNLLSTIQLRSLKLSSQISSQSTPISFNNAQIVFNFMQTQIFQQFSFNQLRNLGTFDLAEGRVGIYIGNEDNFGRMKFLSDRGERFVDEVLLPSYASNKKQSDEESDQLLEKQAPNAYQNMKIIIALYKYPMATIINVFVPFYLLSLLSLGLFFQINDFTGRSISIFMLLTSYIAMIPGIRSSIPPTPNLILIEIIVYLQTLCIIIILIQSLYINGIEDYQFIWHEDISFMIVLGYTVVNFTIILILCLLHKLKWQHQYNKLPQGSSQINTDEDELNTDKWYNDSAQKQFNPYLLKNKLRFLYPEKKVMNNNEVYSNSNVKFITVKNALTFNQDDVK